MPMARGVRGNMRPRRCRPRAATARHRVQHGTDPVFVGKTTTVQIAVSRPPGAPPTSRPSGPTPTTTGLGYLPATAEQPLAQNISAVLISPPQAPADTQWTPPTAVIAAGQPPNIIGRAQWGADELVRCGNRPFNATYPRRGRPPHRREQRLPAAGLGGDRPVHLRLSHPNTGLVRHRLQRAGRQVRPGVRGQGGRADRAGAG